MTAGHQVAIELAYVVIREGATTVPGQKTLVSPDSVVIRKFSLVPGLRTRSCQCCDRGASTRLTLEVSCGLTSGRNMAVCTQEI